MSAAAIVVAGEGWHPGVVGIVASRLVERHRRPCVVIALDGGSGRGSGRSIAAYDLHAGLGARGRAPHALRRPPDGGRAWRSTPAAIPAFRAALAAHAGERLVARRPPARAARRRGGARRRAEPRPGRGAGAPRARSAQANPAPVLMVPGARIEHVTAMGEERDHARFSLAQRRRPRARRRVPHLAARAGRGGREPARRGGEPRAQPLERRGGGAGGAALARRDPRRARSPTSRPRTSGRRSRRERGAIPREWFPARPEPALRAADRARPPRRGARRRGRRPAHQRRPGAARGGRRGAPPQRASRRCSAGLDPDGARAVRLGRGGRRGRLRRAPARARPAAGRGGRRPAARGARRRAGAPRLGRARARLRPGPLALAARPAPAR